MMSTDQVAAGTGDAPVIDRRHKHYHRSLLAVIGLAYSLPVIAGRNPAAPPAFHDDRPGPINWAARSSLRRPAPRSERFQGQWLAHLVGASRPMTDAEINAHNAALARRKAEAAEARLERAA